MPKTSPDVIQEALLLLLIQKVLHKDTGLTPQYLLHTYYLLLSIIVIYITHPLKNNYHLIPFFEKCKIKVDDRVQLN